MRIVKKNRFFYPNKFLKIKLKHVANIYLKSDEMITFLDFKKNEYDVVKKSWGYYATPSIDKRLKKNFYETYLVKNAATNNKFIFIVNIKKKKDFKIYIKKNNIKIIKFLK